MKDKEKGMREDEMVGWHQGFNALEFQQALRVVDGQGVLVCCSPWGCTQSDTTEQMKGTDCIGEENGNPLQYSCLENPRDGGDWWAAISGVAQNRTRLKRLSSSSSNDDDEES